MRALRVVGLGIDGRTVILETVAQRSGERRERFTLPADEGLHAAVRGDLPRLGQIEIELENQMRPREIQARIRAGASVEQVATAAGVPTQRIERFAYPVLLERSRTAELARQAHPVRSDGPDVRTLEDVVAETFSQRGHDFDAVSWDSWRGENGKWVVQLRWRAGRSDNRAHWTFHPGAHGGTVTAIDDHATDLIDPQAATPLRTVPSVTPLATPEPEPVAEQPYHYPAATEPAAQHPAAAPSATASSTASAAASSATRASAGTSGTGSSGAAASGTRAPAASASTRPPADPATEQPAEEHAEDVAEQERSGARAVPDDGPAYRRRPAERTEPAEQQRPNPPARRGRKDRPIVPSWEDVLLGVRSPRE